jgi:hypothetical protein
MCAGTAALCLHIVGSLLLGFEPKLHPPCWTPLQSTVTHHACYSYDITVLHRVAAGGTKGLGKALAREFLTHNDSVIITGATMPGIMEDNIICTDFIQACLSTCRILNQHSVIIT